MLAITDNFCKHKLGEVPLKSILNKRVLNFYKCLSEFVLSCVACNVTNEPAIDSNFFRFQRNRILSIFHKANIQQLMHNKIGKHIAPIRNL